jgi:hypothetical protein
MLRFVQRPEEPNNNHDEYAKHRRIMLCRLFVSNTKKCNDYDMDAVLARHSDDYIQCDREKLQEAVDGAICTLLDEGWELKKMTLEGNSSCIRREYDE